MNGSETGAIITALVAIFGANAVLIDQYNNGTNEITNITIYNMTNITESNNTTITPILTFEDIIYTRINHKERLRDNAGSIISSDSYTLIITLIININISSTDNCSALLETTFNATQGIYTQQKDITNILKITKGTNMYIYFNTFYIVSNTEKSAETYILHNFSIDYQILYQ